MTAATITVEKDADEWKDEGWTSTPNRIIRDPSLTEGEKWVWSWFASHTDTFQFDLGDLVADSPRGRNVVREFVRGLECKGLLTRRQERNTSGQIVAVRYKLHLRPVPEEQRTYVESAAKKKVMTAEAKAALRKNRRPDPAPARAGAGDDASAGATEASTEQSDNRRSDPAPDRPGAGGPGAGGPGAGREVFPYKEEKTTREDQEEPSSSTAAPPREEPPRLDVEALCTRLRDRMIGNGCKPPTITKAWRDAARLMLDRDGRELDKALNLVDWVHADEFWRTNILSMPKFREQYDQLRLRAIADHQQKQRQAARDTRQQQSRTSVAAAATSEAFAQVRAQMAAESGQPLGVSA